MYLMSNPVRPYAWGSRTALPSLQGRPPSGQPEAELWMGAHPADPSLVHTEAGDRSLGEVIAEEPAEVLGEAVAERFVAGRNGHAVNPVRFARGPLPGVQVRAGDHAGP